MNHRGFLSVVFIPIYGTNHKKCDWVVLVYARARLWWWNKGNNFIIMADYEDKRAAEYYDSTMMSHIAKDNWNIRCSRQWDNRHCWLANVINVYLSGRDENWPANADECVEAGAAFVKTWLLGSFRFIDLPSEKTKRDLLEEYLNIFNDKYPDWVPELVENYPDYSHNIMLSAMHVQIRRKLKKGFVRGISKYSS